MFKDKTNLCTDQGRRHLVSLADHSRYKDDIGVCLDRSNMNPHTLHDLTHTHDIIITSAVRYLLRDLSKSNAKPFMPNG